MKNIWLKGSSLLKGQFMLHILLQLKSLHHFLSAVKMIFPALQWFLLLVYMN